MSQVLDRARPSARPQQPSAATQAVAPLWLRGIFAAAWSAAVGLAVLTVIALIIWAADSRTTVSAATAMRFGASLWLAAQRTPLRVPGGTLAIAPLALTIGIGLLLARAAAVLARTSDCRDLGDIAVITVSIAAPYAVIAAVLAVLARTSSIRPSSGAAFVMAAIVGAVAATSGALRGGGLVRTTWNRLPPTLSAGLAAAGRAGGVLLIGATVLTVGSLIAHAGAIHHSLAGYGYGSGRVSIALISLLLLPNAVLFGGAYLTGPGFALGAGSSVSYAGAHLGALPALPLVAGAPTQQAPWPLAALGIAVVLTAGIAAAWPVSSADQPIRQRLRVVSAAAGAVLVAAAVLAGLAGGPVGPGRMSAFGPSPWQVALSLTAELGLIMLIVVAANAWRHQARAMLSGRR